MFFISLGNYEPISVRWTCRMIGKLCRAHRIIRKILINSSRSIHMWPTISEHAVHYLEVFSFILYFTCIVYCWINNFYYLHLMTRITSGIVDVDHFSIGWKLKLSTTYFAILSNIFRNVLILILDFLEYWNISSRHHEMKVRALEEASRGKHWKQHEQLDPSSNLF